MRPLPPHENNFDALRLLGALLVVISHQFALSGRWEPRLVGDHSFGNIGVLNFFVISGYLVSASWCRDPHPARFLVRRFLRIAPGLAVSLCLTFALVSASGLLGFPGNPSPAFNGSLWTIRIEVYCYLVLLGVAMLLSYRAFSWLGVLILAGWAITRPVEPFQGAYLCLFFVSGALCYRYALLRTRNAMLVLSILGAALLALGNTGIALVVLVPPIVVGVGTRSWPIVRNAGRFGDLSYGTYIYAWPVQQLYVHWLGATSNYFALFIPSLLTTLALAYASWHLVEQPSLSLNRRDIMKATPS